MKFSGQLLLLCGAASVAFGASQTVPEIDASTATSAVALVAGGVMLLRARLRK